MKIGDDVLIKGDDFKTLYKIIDIKESEKSCLIKGCLYRVVKCVNINELEKASNEIVKKNNFEENRKIEAISRHFEERTAPRKYLLGKILHIDGDEEYLEKCMDLYDKSNVYAVGIMVKEEIIHKQILMLVRKYTPNIVVITGHDMYDNNEIKSLSSYTNTKNFVKAILKVRQNIKNDVIIIAGACQSNFEALIAAGADFASSPKRINVHTYDPAVIAIKVATTSFAKIVNDDIYKYIENGRDAFGGLQTFGKMRMLI